MEKNKNNEFVYQERTLYDMLNSKIDIMYDFTELDRKFADKEISYDEWTSEFSRLRKTHSCTIGGSDVSVLVGNNNYKTPTALQKEIWAPAAHKKAISREQYNIFARGHLYEDSIANMSALLLEQKLKDEKLCDSVTIRPFKQQVRNHAFPNCVGNFDCLVEITGGPYAGNWLGEVKSTEEESSYWKNYFSDESLEDVNRIPPAYLNQMDFYLGIMPALRGGIMLASCGFAADKHVELMFERDNERSLNLLNIAQEFCEKTARGIPVDDEIVKSIHAFEMSYPTVKGELSENLVSDISKGKYIESIAELDSKIKTITSQLKEIESEIKEKYLDLVGELPEELSHLEKQKELLINKSIYLLGDASSGEATLEDGRKIRLEVTTEISWDKDVKELLKKEYPEAYDACIKCGTRYKKKCTISDFQNDTTAK